MAMKDEESRIVFYLHLYIISYYILEYPWVKILGDTTLYRDCRRIILVAVAIAVEVKVGEIELNEQGEILFS